MEAEQNGSASQSVVDTSGQRKETFWDNRKAQMVGRTRYWVARRTAQWAASEDDERQQGLGATNTPIRQTGLLSNDAVTHPLMNCGQVKINNNGNNSPATAWGSDDGSGDVQIGQDGGQVSRVSDRDEDATGNSVYDVPIAINRVNYPIAGAPHPINKLVGLCKCESYRHLTVQLHLRVANSRCNFPNVSQYRHLTVQPHLQVVNSWCHHRHLMVQPHHRVVNCWSTGSRYHNRHLTVQLHLRVVNSWSTNALVGMFLSSSAI
jgi:hypothetical protein